MVAMAKNKTKSCRCCDGSGKEIDHVAMGKELRAERKADDLSLTWIASLLGVSKAYLHDLEAGKRHWTEDRIKKYRAALKL